MSEKLRAKLAVLPMEQASEVKRQSLETLREYSTERGMSFPAEVLIVSGTKGHRFAAETMSGGGTEDTEAQSRKPRQGQHVRMNRLRPPFSVALR